MKVKVDKLEAAKRRDDILQCMLQGWRTSEIIKVYREKWNCSHQNVRKYIVAAQQELAASLEPSREWRRKLYIERLESLFGTCMQKEHYKIALEVQRELNSITRIKEPEKSGDDAIEVITISSREPKAIEAKSSQIHGIEDDEQKS